MVFFPSAQVPERLVKEYFKNTVLIDSKWGVDPIYFWPVLFQF
jgi:hypothetical protein